MSCTDFPKELLYNKDYSWIKIDKDVATVGIIELAAKKVKEFVFVQLPEKGRRIKQGETYVSLEAVKWSGHLSSPVGGEIIEVNDSLFDEPSRINKNPYGSWIMKIKIEDKTEINKLMDSRQAIKFYCQNE